MTHEHLNDEQLSAHLDGEPAAAPSSADGAPGAGVPEGTVEAEIAACERCRARLAALAGARALVRLPVTPVPPSVRAEAVAAAVAEGLRTDQDSGQAPAVLSYGRRRRSRSTGWLVGTAAAAVVLVAVGLALGATHPNTPSASSAGSVAPHRSVALAAPPTTEKSAAAVPDFGSIGSVKALRSKLAGVGDFSASNDQAKSGESTGGSAVPSSASQTPGQPATGTVAGGTATAAAAAAAASSPCVADAPAEGGASGTPTLLATVTYDHVSALVVAIDATGAPATSSPSRLVVVVARTGCRLLARTTL